MVVPGTTVVVARVTASPPLNSPPIERVEITRLGQAFGGAEISGRAGGATVELVVERAHLADVSVERGVVELGEIHRSPSLERGWPLFREGPPSFDEVVAAHAGVHGVVPHLLVAVGAGPVATSRTAIFDARTVSGAFAAICFAERTHMAVEIGLGHDAIDEADAGGFGRHRHAGR